MATTLVRAQPLYQAVRERLRELILSGELAAGQRITEVDLAQSLGVSRTPVREAMKQLMIEGLVRRESLGYSIFRPTVQDVADIYVCRAALESQAVAVIGEGVGEGAIEELGEVVHETEQARGRGDLATFLRLNTRFHEMLVRASGNLTLIATYEAVGIRAMLCRTLTLQDENAREGSASEHGRIVELLRLGQPAEAHVRDHIYRSALRAIRTLDPEARFTSPTMRYLERWGEGAPAGE